MCAQLVRKITARLRQVGWAVTARPLNTGEWQEINTWLSAAELTLFRRFPAAEQRHALRVLRRVQASGPPNPALCRAALLHDIGKQLQPPTLLDRIVIVLGMTFLRPWAERWGRDATRRSPLRRPFVVRRWHPEWGAALLEAAGSDAATVALIRDHQTPPDCNRSASTDYALLARLQAADDEG